MTRTLSLSEVKLKFSRLILNVIKNEDEIIITRNGKPAAVLINAEEYESWKETQEIKQSPELMKEIQDGLKKIAKSDKSNCYTLEELFGPDSSKMR